MTNPGRHVVPVVIAAFGLVLTACQATDRHGDNSIHTAPDSALSSEAPAVDMPLEPPPGSASHL
ncbi:MAG TPA: hypothetical protein VKS60_03715 [Stellaceae bacterium]|nr:hypothetical protein [Stellaceae bacterium]